MANFDTFMEGIPNPRRSREEEVLQETSTMRRAPFVTSTATK